MTINILTLKVGDKYSSDYVNKLYNGIKRNTSVDFKFYCYTEDKDELNENIIVVPLEDPYQFYKQWHKMTFHKSNFGGIPNGEKCLILDIDWIITNNLDDIFYWDFNEDIAVFERWWSTNRTQCKLNGGFQMFYMGQTNYVWEKFISDPLMYQEYYYKSGLCAYPFFGEQNFIDETVISKSWLPMDSFGKYTSEYINFINQQWWKEVSMYDSYFIDNEFAESVKMVHFADRDNMIHEYKDEWIKKYWI